MVLHFFSSQTPEEINVLWTECIEEGPPQRVKAVTEHYSITNIKACLVVYWSDLIEISQTILLLSFRIATITSPWSTGS